MRYVDCILWLIISYMPAIQRIASPQTLDVAQLPDQARKLPYLETMIYIFFRIVVET